jgi:hypothetical protein
VLAAAARCIFSSVLEAMGRCQIRRTQTWMSRCARYLPLAARSSEVAQESAAGPRANLDQAELQCLSDGQQRVVSATLIKSAIVRLPASTCDGIPLARRS